MPDLLARTIREEAWRDRVIKTGERVQFSSFEEFVVTPPLEGLGADRRTLENLVRDHSEAKDLLDRVLQREGGRPPETYNNVKGFEAPVGNAATQALRRLRKDQPELHQRVLDGELSAHRAMVQAGYRRPTATVYIDSPEAAVRALLRRFSAAELEHALTVEKGKA